MATIDLSRSATDFRKHFKSVRAQQGRTFVEDDHNENERIHTEELRNEILEIVGASGAPGDGFLVGSPIGLTGGKIEFPLSAGSLYVGGYRLKLDAPTTLQTQPDYLEIFGSNMLDAPTGPRFDLVYVETYLVPVSSVEDSETFEVGLGGPDTAMRMHQLQRVGLLPGVASGDCKAAWSSLAAALAADKRGVLSDENELIPDTTLSVQFANNGSGTDLCSPPVAGGYLGAENQAIRVEIVDQGHLTWGFDNAAPLYRVKVDLVAGALTQVTMLTEPKDQAHWPMAQQIVEFLPWSAVLPNNEKTAEIGGFLSRVGSSYDPDTQQFTLDSTLPLPATFGVAWKQRPDATPPAPAPLAPTPKDVFFYMRVWNRGGDKASPPAIPFTKGVPVDLLGTGLQVVINGDDRPLNDYWIIAARPDSPDLLVPWSLKSGRGPNGYRHFFAPLGVIQWTAAGGAVTGTLVDDCRHPFLPLTKIRGCCTVTVGDGKGSFGQFTSIQNAINALPVPQGGEVCILPGTYTENFTVKALQHIVIHGCGSQTILTPKVPAAPVITIEDSQFITIRDLTIATDTSVGVLISSTAVGIRKKAPSEHIRLRAMHFEVRDASAIACYYASDLAILENSVHVKALAGPLVNGSSTGMAAALFLFGETILIARNHILTDSQERIQTAVGGIQLFGLTSDVRIEHNRIRGGNGNGITLGAVFWLDSNIDPTTGTGTGLGVTVIGVIWVDAAGCVHVGGGGTPPTGGDGQPQVPVAWGLFFNILILDNDIQEMGASGVGTPDLPTGVQGVPIVDIIEISRNRISTCAQLDRSQAQNTSKTPLPGLGGIALDFVAFVTVRDNWIVLNGPSFVPSICGVWFGISGGVIIERNEILENGPRIQTQQPFEAGPRAGVRVEFAAPAPTLNPSGGIDPHETEFPALRVHDNVIVAPSGPALAALVQGPVSIANNELTSGIATATSTVSAVAPLDVLRAAFGGEAVFIFDVGTLSELSSSDVNFATVAQHQNFMVGPTASIAAAAPPPFIPGDILFQTNRVLLNFPDVGRTVLISCVTLFGFADIGMESNQLIARTGNHPLQTNALVVGFSLRCEGNRCQDRFDLGLSGFTLAVMNATADNQGTRCFLAMGEAALLVTRDNKSWIDVTLPGACAELEKAVEANYQLAGYTPNPGK